MKKSYENYFNNEELLEFLKHHKSNYPNYFDYESIGKSTWGEDIWLITLSDKTVGRHDEKPAFWIEANIHASEVTGTQGALYFCERLLNDIDNTKQSMNDDFKINAKELFKKVTYYILPRFTPDGARAFFNEKNSSRSTPLDRPFHYSESSFKRKDMDGDGEITLMRWQDPSGPFKELEGFPGVLVPRQPYENYEEGKVYYNVLPEGVFENYDGFTKVKNYDFGYDFNRQSPSFFTSEGLQKGAGEMPLEFPETKAVAEAFRKRKNIYASNSYHTYGGFVIKTPANVADSDVPLEDLMIMQKMGELLTSETDYTLHSGNDDFIYVPGQSLPGTFDEWYYLSQGVLGITIEYWDLWKHADIPWKKAVEKYESISEENMKKLIHWCQKNLSQEDYFLPWEKYDHPQLGSVEIGGFKTGFFLTNPPLKFLKAELEKVFRGTFLTSKIYPNIEIKEKNIIKIDEKTTKLELVITNTGYLPTNGCQQSLKVKSIGHPDIKYNITNFNSDFNWIKKVNFGEIKHLKGFADGMPRISPFFGTSFAHAFEQKLEWVIQGKANIEVEIGYYKGGVLRTNFDLCK
jgi:hypothetical protein